jgi:iron complex outermembrane receptor protein
MMRKIYLILLVCLPATKLFSQVKKEGNDTLRNIELPEAVIKTGKANLLSEKNKLTITNGQIRKQNGAEDLPYLLNGISSVVISSDAGTGTGYTGIRIRGADLTRINVTMNGVPVNDAESQATYFVDMPDILSSTKEIQINKGVGSSKNGVGSFGASIAVNNLDVDHTKPLFLFQTECSSFNTFKNVVKASTGLINEKFITTIRLSSLQSDGYIQRASSDLKGMQLTSKYVFNRSTQLVFNYLNGSQKTGQAWNGVSQDSLATNRTFNELGLKSDGTYYKNQTDNYGQRYYQLFFDTKINVHVAVGSTLFLTNGRGYYEEYKTAQSYADYNLPNDIQGNDTITQTDLIRQLWLDNAFYGGRLYATYVSKKLDVGLYLNYNQYEGHHHGDVIWAQENVPDHYRWYALTATKKDFNAYGMVDYRFGQHGSFFADVQARRVNYVINGFRKNPDIQQDLDYLFFNPKVKVSWQNGKHLLSLLAGIAQKEPNREDVEAGTTFLPRPEKMFNAELNYSIRCWNIIDLHATAFLMDYTDQLVLTGKINDVGAYTRSNVPKSYRAGIELEANLRWPSKLIEAKANVALSRNKIKHFIEYIDDYDNGGQMMHSYANTDISFSPSLISAVQVSVYPFRKRQKSFIQYVSIDILEKYVGEQYLDNTSKRNRMLKSYMTSDVICHWPLSVKSHTVLNFKAGINNLFNKRYEANGYTYSYQYDSTLTTQNYYSPQAGRRWMVGIGIEL